MISLTITNPIDLLKYVLSCQDYGQEVGTVSASAKIKLDGDGGFNSPSLDPVRNIKIRFQVSEFDKSYTDDLIKKICSQFSLIQYTDNQGFECVKYLFANRTNAPVFVIDQTTEIDNFTPPDPARICHSPVIKYNYDYASKEYKNELTISNVQMDSYSSDYTSGFPAGLGETYWNLCKEKLFPLVRHLEEMDSSLSENEFICDIDGAIWRLNNVIRLMKSASFDFTIPFEIGIRNNLKAGDIIGLRFDCLSTTGDMVYNAVITSVSLSKNSNSCSISTMLLSDLNEEIIGALQDSYDEQDTNYQDSYDLQSVNLMSSYSLGDIVTSMQYIEPTGKLTHITLINDELSVLLEKLDKCQLGIITDGNKGMMFADDFGDFHLINTCTSSTPNKLVKYIDNRGVTGDSIISEIDENTVQIDGILNVKDNDVNITKSTSQSVSLSISNTETISDGGLILGVDLFGRGFLRHVHNEFSFRQIPQEGVEDTILRLHNTYVELGYKNYSTLCTLNFYGNSTFNNNVCINSLTDNRVIITDVDKKLVSSNVTSTELGYLSGVSSNVQAQLNSKMSIASYPDLVAIEALTGTSGFLKKTSANTWILDTNTYLTGNQNITLSGVITGSGSTSIVTSIADNALSIAKTNGLQDALNGKLTNTYTVQLNPTPANNNNTYRHLATITGVPYGTFTYYVINWCRVFYSLQHYSNVTIKIENFYTNWSISLEGKLQNNTLYYYINTTNNSLELWAKRWSGNGSGYDWLTTVSSISSSHITYDTTSVEVADPGVTLTQVPYTLDWTHPDLTAIENLTGTIGLLRKTAANTWTLDNNTYLTSVSWEQVQNRPNNVITGSGGTANYVAAFYNNSLIVNSPISIYNAEDIRMPARLDIGGNYTGASPNPVYLATGNSYSNDTSKTKCKLYFYRDVMESAYFGIGVGPTSDIQHHSEGTHDFYINNGLKASIGSTGININGRIVSIYNSTDTACNAGNLELRTDGVNAPNSKPLIGFHRTGVDALSLVFMGGTNLSVQTHNNSTLYQLLHTGNFNVNIQRLWSTSHPADYYITNDWRTVNGTFRWRIVSNHGDNCSVAHSDVATNASALNGYGYDNFIGKNGNSFYQAGTWLQFAGSFGLYFPNSGSGTHIYPNSTKMYGSFIIEGTKGSAADQQYQGFIFGNVSNSPTLMLRKSDGLGGIYCQDNAKWQWYYDPAIDNLRIGLGSYPVNHSGIPIVHSTQTDIDLSYGSIWLAPALPVYNITAGSNINILHLLNGSPVVNGQRLIIIRTFGVGPVSCLVSDEQSGRTYNIGGPSYLVAPSGSEFIYNSTIGWIPLIPPTTV